jgi:O-antigen/teichoic acid export membrane protein
VAGNTIWYSGELALSVASAFLTSIPIARIIGPTNLSYFTYLQWLTNTSGILAMVGIPVTTRKYMAEYLAQDNTGTAWAVFRSSFRVQAWISAVLLIFGGLLVIKAVRPDYHYIALFLLLTVAIKLMACIPSSANSAAENLKANFYGSTFNAVTVITLVNVGLYLGWGLLGVAASMCLGILLELIAKTVLMLRWLKPSPSATLPRELRTRMYRFSGQGLLLMLLQTIVWDRSDLVFLKWLDPDPRQVTFFGLAFNLVDKILLLPKSFGQVIGISVMAEYGRNREKLSLFVSAAMKYGILLSVPVMLGTAVISGPLIRTMYGNEYLPAIPVLAIGAVLALAKPLMDPLQSHMLAEERQVFLVVWTLICGVVNVILDITLIPWAGARGAMLANGLAQTFAIAGIWFQAGRYFSVRVAPGDIARILLSGVAMALPVWWIGRLPIPPAVQLCIGIPLGALIYLTALRLLKVLDETDGSRLRHLVSRLPGLPGKLAGDCIAGMVRRGSVV